MHTHIQIRIYIYSIYIYHYQYQFAPGNFSSLLGNCFPCCRIDSLAICSMLNLKAATSTVLATFWNHFHGNCSILGLETEGKCSILLELAAATSAPLPAAVGSFGGWFS